MAKDLPAFCRVAGVVQPAINFEVWLPPASGDKRWNRKFNGVGNGGLAGFIAYVSMMQSLARGYATASTDTGHVDKFGDDFWALDEKLLVDFASRSIHMTAVAAKAVVRTYYSQDPQYSYFTGCSGGGGQALSEAQRYPADYDGIIAGAPANFPTRQVGVLSPKSIIAVGGIDQAAGENEEAGHEPAGAASAQQIGLKLALSRTHQDQGGGPGQP